MHFEGSRPCHVLFGQTTVVSRVSNVLATLVSYAKPKILELLLLKLWPIILKIIPVY